MEIVLGLDADGSAWPPMTSDASVQAGGMVTGPAGLLQIVESAIGLGGPATPAVKRLAAWRAKLAAVDGPDRFWHQSFAADSFATARMLLGWRDRLTEAGWHYRAVSAPPRRLADLAAAEEAPSSLPPGPADRLRFAIASLREDPPLGPIVEKLRLLDDRALMPPGLQALIDALEATGTEILEESVPAVPGQGDLGAVQGLLRGLGPAVIKGDGRFVLLEAETETTAAELVADRLKADQDLSNVVILATRPTAVLDAALRRRHLPRLGIGAPSPLRGVLQALSLGLATRWAPFDAHRMLEFLQLPRCPIPREVRRALTEVLPETPGRGGKAWRDAVAKGLGKFEERVAQEEPDEAKRRRRLKRANEDIVLWLEGSLAEPDQGMPATELLELCAALSRWAIGLSEQNNPQAEILSGYASALAEAVRQTGLMRLPRVDVERMLDVVLADGTRDPFAIMEAAPWGTASAPGAIWGRPHTLVWWGFDAPSLPEADVWQEDEAQALTIAGCRPGRAIDQLMAASASWRRPLLATREKVLLVAIHNASSDTHPLAHELSALLESHPELHPRAEALNGAKQLSVGGVILSRTNATPASLPAARVLWTVDQSISVQRKKDSATALELLLACPFAWVMKYAAKLREGRFAQIAQDGQLVGLLAHKLAEELLTPGELAPADILAAKAKERLPSLLQEAAAPLLQVGAAAERTQVERGLPIAIAHVARLLHDAGLEVIEAEAHRTNPDLLGAGQAFEGAIDLLLQDASGKPVLLDLKWSHSVRSYRKRIIAGQAVQLAAYSQLVGAEERAAYVLLTIPTVIGGPGLRGFKPEDSAHSLASTWHMTCESRMRRGNGLAAGHIHALGNRDAGDDAPDPDEAALVPPAPCSFCAYGVLCGKKAAA